VNPNRFRTAGALLVVVGLALGATGCARYQMVGVYGPPGSTVFVDGTEVGPVPRQIRVSREEAHSIYVKKPGFQPQLVVLELNDAADGVDYLTPADVSVRLLRRRREPGAEGESPKSEPLDRDVQVEPEERR